MKSISRKYVVIANVAKLDSKSAKMELKIPIIRYSNRNTLVMNDLLAPTSL